ncbi:MAG: hypothetical protein H7257_00845 [Taibaiella sp.]|nr:hypothetical protein [Taibaiella sp.]
MLRYSISLFLFFLCIIDKTGAQELFVYSEPASNMPAKSAGLRLTNWLMREEVGGTYNYHLIPELMVGINKKLMFHAEGFFSNTIGGLNAEGGGLYAKYRFYSNDKMYQHLRMAAFGRITVNNTPIHQEEIATNGHNSGYQAGLIATQLLHKTALSATGYYERATGNTQGNELPVSSANSAFSYMLSAGRLLAPKHYSNYKQVNVNFMTEVIGQVLWNGKQYIDIAPSLQFIFNSQTRVDIGYRHELFTDLERTAPNGFLLRVEHLLFNAL